ncbi:hypothetical protein VPHK567_0292 [Vibrio phage K567]|nr:hypothetical protein MYOV011v1_p0331 [Vibrio phage 6E35.1a]
MKHRIVHLKDGLGIDVYRLQYKTTFFPFWRWVKGHGEGGSYGIREFMTSTTAEQHITTRLNRIKSRKLRIVAYREAP